VLRFSLHLYNNIDDVERVLELTRGFPEGGAQGLGGLRGATQRGRVKSVGVIDFTGAVHEMVRVLFSPHCSCSMPRPSNALKKNIQYWQGFPPGGEADQSARHQQLVLKRKCPASRTIVSTSPARAAA
jgi:hypothetical protein